MGEKIMKGNNIKINFENENVIIRWIIIFLNIFFN